MQRFQPARPILGAPIGQPRFSHVPPPFGQAGQGGEGGQCRAVVSVPIKKGPDPIEAPIRMRAFDQPRRLSQRDISRFENTENTSRCARIPARDAPCQAAGSAKLSRQQGCRA